MGRSPPVSPRRAAKPRRRAPRREPGWSCSYDTTVLRLVVTGLVAGTFSALFGVGGGIVAVPLLVLFAGFPERVATGTSLAAIGITALAGVLFFGIRGDVDVGYAALVGIPAAGGALIGTAIQQRITAEALAYFFAALLVAVSVWLLVS